MKKIGEFYTVNRLIYGVFNTQQGLWTIENTPVNDLLKYRHELMVSLYLKVISEYPEATHISNSRSDTQFKWELWINLY